MIITSIACFYSAEVVGYNVIPLILLMIVSFLAMLFEIIPVIVAAILSAVIWNYFFIPPLFTFHISKAEDLLMFSLYFLVALVNTVLTFRIRAAEKRSRDKEEKEKTIRLYNTLLNSLSHELRTPISTIVGAVDTLKENKHKLSPALQDELLHEIDVAGVRLNRQVENLLNMSRLESGMLKPKADWCDINELINGIIVKQDLRDHQLIYNTDDQLPLFSLDAGLLEQILQNLIHNALLYTVAGTSIQIEARHDSDCCKITVSDNGSGFTEEEMNLVFDKFYRLPNSKPGGSGLGLSIVKGFVEAQNGTIQLTKSNSGGACFTIRIPANTSYLQNLKHE